MDDETLQAKQHLETTCIATRCVFRRISGQALPPDTSYWEKDLPGAANTLLTGREYNSLPILFKCKYPFTSGFIRGIFFLDEQWACNLVV
jgi:hypothetical protein